MASESDAFPGNPNLCAACANMMDGLEPAANNEAPFDAEIPPEQTPFDDIGILNQ